MVRRKTLAEELEELATTAPTREHDPEEGVYGDEAVLEATDDELEHDLPRRRKAEKGLPLRGTIDLDDSEYAGKTVSRDAIFGDEDASEKEDGGEESRSEELSAEEEENGTRGEFREDIEEEADDRPVAAAYGPVQGGGMDEEIAALEREFEAARAGGGAADAIVASRERSARERAKGQAVKTQRTLWERMLELRILLQGCLQASNRLVRPHMHAAACAAAPELCSGLRGLSDGAAATLDTLLDLSNALLDRIPDCAAASTEATPAASVGKKRSRAGAAEDDSVPGTKWARMSAAYQRFAPYRDASMDRWHRKTMLMTGSGALRGNLRALNQSLSSQVSALVKDSGPAVQRTQLLKAHSKPLMGHASQATEDRDEEEEAEQAALEERDPETFDDGEFYQQMLKEFLEGSGADAAAVSASAQGGRKKRKNVDRRASKGRKLRYQVMEKLVHFMAPVQQAEPPALAAQLFANLFGQSRATAASS